MESILFNVSGKLWGGKTSALESVLLEAGTQLSFSFHTFQCIREAVWTPQPKNLFLWRLKLGFVNLNGVHSYQCIREAVGRPQPGNLFFWRLELSFH
jgi:hypothetical protein